MPKRHTPRAQLDIFDRDPQQDLFARRAATPGLGRFADELVRVAKKLESEARELEIQARSKRWNRG